MALQNGIPFNWDDNEGNGLPGSSFVKTKVVDELENQIRGNNISSPFEVSPFGKDWDKKIRDYSLNEFKNIV